MDEGFEIKPAAMKEDEHSVVGKGAKSSGDALDGLDAAVESFTHDLL